MGAKSWDPAPMDAIFHVATEADWSDAQTAGEYRVSTLGRSLDDVGFIHCSHRQQVERVANVAYRAAGPLLLLTIDPDMTGAEIREESGGGGETFPHLYGPLPVDAVIQASPFAPGVGGLFVPSSSWLSPKVEVRTSTIEGLGLFALQPIVADEPVAVMGGRPMTDDDFARFVAGAERWSAAAIGEGLNLVQEADDPLARGNHSCDANLWMADELTLVARRPIQADQELTVDYALMTVAEDWSMKCLCGAPDCRGAITGNDWQRIDVQARYRGHFAPFIELRHRVG